jgi:hypothetical protein
MSTALCAKVRRRYGRQLSAAQLSALSALCGIDEAQAFLQARSPQDARLAVADSAQRRRMCDEALADEFRSLAYFVSPQDKAFWQFFPHMQTLRRLMADYPALRTAEDFRTAAIGTIFETTVSRTVQSGRLPDFAAAEALLRSGYERYMLRLIAAQYKGGDARRLKRLFGEATDRLNLMNLLRLKTYFPAEAETLARYLPAHHRLNQKLYARLSAAKTVDETRTLLATQPRFAALAHLPLPALAQEQTRTLRRLYRQVIHSGEASIAVAFAYLCDREYALADLCAALDTAAERTRKKEVTAWSQP